MTVYELFSGVRLIYNDIFTVGGEASQAVTGDVLEVSFCCGGRSEYRRSRHCYYLAEGEYIIRRCSAGDEGAAYPTGQYSGVTLTVDMDTEFEGFSELFDGAEEVPRLLADRLGQELYISALRDSAEHIFRELWECREKASAGLMRIKVIELFMALGELDMGTSQAKEHRLTDEQAELAEKVCRFAIANMNEHYTIAQLAEMTRVSQTKLKSCFRMVYGCSLYAYMRRQKMYTAAELLRTTDRNILDIAVDCGYDNGSKFAKAFRDVMGRSPRDYRKYKGVRMEHFTVRRAEQPV